MLERTPRVTARRPNALSVDVEDWFHDESRSGGPVRAEELARIEPRVARNLGRLLEIFAAHNTRATLFFLGDVTRQAASLVREAVGLGHEIACHGLRHRPVGELSREEFRDDVRRARAMVEDAAGVAVTGFRAPCFIRRPADLWVLDTLAREGFRYDSSYLPLTCWPRAARPLSPDYGPLRLPNGLWEFPLPLTRIATGHRLPFAAGGFVLRALPFSLTRRYLRRFNQQVGPAIVYTHPWEIDPQSGKLDGTPAYVRFFNGVGRKRLEARLDRLLSEFRFAPIAEVYASELAQSASAA
jgi:polysaccharide deacetylase family protein (PEP-CTERM system associated)